MGRGVLDKEKTLFPCTRSFSWKKFKPLFINYFLKRFAKGTSNVFFCFWSPLPLFLFLSSHLLIFLISLIIFDEKFVSECSGSGSVGRAADSDTRGPRFDSDPWQNFIQKMLTVEKTKMKKNEAGNCPLKIVFATEDRTWGKSKVWN